MYYLSAKINWGAVVAIGLFAIPFAISLVIAIVERIQFWIKAKREYEHLTRYISLRSGECKSKLNLHLWTESLMDTIKKLEGVSDELSSNVATLKSQHERYLSLLKQSMESYDKNLLWTQQESEKHIAELQKRHRDIEARLRSNYERELAQNEQRIQRQKRLLEYECDVWREELVEVQNALSESIQSFFAHISELKADQIHRELRLCIEYLINKPRPIKPETAAEFRTKLNSETKLYYKNWQEIQLKYEYLLDLYQITDEDIEEEESTEEIVTERNFLTDEEYRQLTPAEKSDLALSRYNAGAKSIKRIGYDYELYCGYWLKTTARCKRVIQFGEQEGKKDHGRDIIAFDGQKTYVVQCKRWKQDKTIHEKHIFQLFGSTVEYCIHNNIPITNIGHTVIPLFLTTANYSSDAKRFANELQVVLQMLPQGDFPQIKCNIGANGEKIYHLPFDQQYNTTIIEERKGEFFTWSAQDAESRGFRRAMRHIIQ